MPVNTAHGFPYVLPADALVDFPVSSKALADQLEASVGASPVATNILAVADWMHLPLSPTLLALGFAHLRIVATLRGNNASTSVIGSVQFNDDAATAFDSHSSTSGGTGATVQVESIGAAGIGRIGSVPAASAPAGVAGAVVIDIPDFARTVFNKVALSHVTNKVGIAAGNIGRESSAAFWRSSAAITKVTLIPSAGLWLAGSRASVYAFR